MEFLLVNQAPIRREMFVNVLPPVGLLSIAAYVEKKGIPVDVVDCYIDDLSGRDIQKYEKIGFSINIANVENSLKTIYGLKRQFPEKEFIVGGPLCNSMPENFIRTEGIDVVVVGEGEETVYELLTETNREKIKGIFFQNGKGGFVATEPRQWIADLDTLPYAALNKVDITKYYSPIKKGLPISNLMSSRGCPYQCTFCFKSMGSKWRCRSPENVVDEIEWQVKDLGVKEICVYDDNFTLDEKRSEQICDLMLERGIKVHLQFTNGLRIDKLNRVLLEKMKLAGTWIIGLAPETGNEETMKRIKKKFDLDQAREVSKLCHECHINTYGFYMVGFPWETQEEIEDTIRFALELDTDLAQFSRVTPLPNTELFEMVFPEGCDIDFTKERGLFHGKPSGVSTCVGWEDVEGLIKSAYRRYYLRPGRVLRLLALLSIRDLWTLFTYSILTKNI